MIVPTWRTLNLATAIVPVEAQRLRELAKDRTVLEVGAANGYSAIVMALAGAVHVTSIDSHRNDTWLGDTFSTMMANLEAFGVDDRVTITADYSKAAMRWLLNAGQKFQFIFLDGSTVPEENQSDVDLGVQLLEPGGVIARHDYGHPNQPFLKDILDTKFPQGPDRITNTLYEVTVP
jgi:predicted O-methyltransferase YrrM